MVGGPGKATFDLPKYRAAPGEPAIMRGQPVPRLYQILCVEGELRPQAHHRERVVERHIAREAGGLGWQAHLDD